MTKTTIKPESFLLEGGYNHFTVYGRDSATNATHWYYILLDGEDITAQVCGILGHKQQADGTIRIVGGGMDMVFNTLYQVFIKLFPTLRYQDHAIERYKFKPIV